MRAEERKNIRTCGKATNMKKYKIRTFVHMHGFTIITYNLVSYVSGMFSHLKGPLVKQWTKFLVLHANFTEWI